MDKGVLVSFNEILTQEMIKAGAELISFLDKSHFIVRVAFWMQDDEARIWRLVIATPELRTDGPKKVYKNLLNKINKMQNPKIDLSQIAVIDNFSNIIKTLKIAIKTGDGISGIQFTGNNINGFQFPNSYIYRVT